MQLSYKQLSCHPICCSSMSATAISSKLCHVCANLRCAAAGAPWSYLEAAVGVLPWYAHCRSPDAVMRPSDKAAALCGHLSSIATGPLPAQHTPSVMLPASAGWQYPCMHVPCESNWRREMLPSGGGDAMLCAAGCCEFIETHLAAAQPQWPHQTARRAAAVLLAGPWHSGPDTCAKSERMSRNPMPQT